MAYLLFPSHFAWKLEVTISSLWIFEYFTRFKVTISLHGQNRLRLRPQVSSNTTTSTSTSTTCVFYFGQFCNTGLASAIVGWKILLPEYFFGPFLQIAILLMGGRACLNHLPFLIRFCLATFSPGRGQLYRIIIWSQQSIVLHHLVSAL